VTAGLFVHRLDPAVDLLVEDVEVGLLAASAVMGDDRFDHPVRLAGIGHPRTVTGREEDHDVVLAHRGGSPGECVADRRLDRLLVAERPVPLCEKPKR
jgi:hypothetical protein